MADLFFDVIGDYAMTTAFGITGLKNLGIAKEVENQLKEKGYVDFENNTFNIPENLELSDVELLIDFYIGTILNSTPVYFAKTHSLEIELAEKFDQFKQVFEANDIILKWNGLYFGTLYTKYNQLVLSCLGRNCNMDGAICFNLTSKTQE